MCGQDLFDSDDELKDYSPDLSDDAEPVPLPPGYERPELQDVAG